MVSLAPPSAAMIVIGDEILSGKVQEANLVALAQTLRTLGIALGRVVVVADDVDTIAGEVGLLSPRYDWLFTSGGVGPTHDDVTVEAVAKAFGVRVVSSPKMEEMLHAHYRERCTAGHLRMALIPEHASLEVTQEITWPTIRLRNTWLLPGIPEVFRIKLAVVASVISREMPLAPPFVSHAAYMNLDEGVLKNLIDKIVSAYPDVAVGSYPKWLDPSYKTKVTFDGRNEARVLSARDAFVALLPHGEPQRVE